MNIRDRIEDIEQQIFIASSEGDMDAMYMLEAQLEQLRNQANLDLEEEVHAFDSRLNREER
ncbi:hypothetical protein [Vibrio sp. SCSIO 43136]|uniref:hypothetical protein n=1 Tax=Vibrio sp. SCSIO 43136 TaxID=2819101 RepID=UPI0020750891|nr:hypothetical protein [Vibrio sp. SCSIO 43136]USD68163.1 hypothetical protein J4N39_18500 [Vibrio sp. SCSIO 43136]